MLLKKTLLEGFGLDDLEESYIPRKAKTLYSYAEKAETINKYLDAKNQDLTLSLRKFAESENLTKSVLFNWVKDKDRIFRKYSESKEMID